MTEPLEFVNGDGYRFEVYRDDAGRWRWRAVARNGRIVGASEQSYSRRWYALFKAHRSARTGTHT